MADKWEWVLHQSHEQSLTVAGDRLLNPIKKAWPQWNEHLYTGWDYVRPSNEEIQRLTRGSTSS